MAFEEVIYEDVDGFWSKQMSWRLNYVAEFMNYPDLISFEKTAQQSDELLEELGLDRDSDQIIYKFREQQLYKLFETLERVYDTEWLRNRISEN